MFAVKFPVDLKIMKKTIEKPKINLNIKTSIVIITKELDILLEHTFRGPPKLVRVCPNGMSKFEQNHLRRGYQTW